MPDQVYVLVGHGAVWELDLNAMQSKIASKKWPHMKNRFDAVLLKTSRFTGKAGNKTNPELRFDSPPPKCLRTGEVSFVQYSVKISSPLIKRHFN
jgi:hypothetical protein